MGSNPRTTAIMIMLVAAAIGYMIYDGAGINMIGMNGLKAGQARNVAMQDSIQALQMQIDSAKRELAKGTVEHGAGSAEGNVADVFAPDQLIDIFEGPGVETGFLPYPGYTLQSLAHTTIHFTDADQVHRGMMHMTRPLHRCTETIGNAQQHPIGLHKLRDALPGPEPVLDRNHDRSRTH